VSFSEFSPDFLVPQISLVQVQDNHGLFYDAPAWLSYTEEFDPLPAKYQLSIDKSQMPQDTLIEESILVTAS
jgi:hypothetical protein